MSTTLSTPGAEKPSAIKTYSKQEQNRRPKDSSSPSTPKPKTKQKQKSALASVLRQTHPSNEDFSSSEDDVENENSPIGEDALPPPGYDRLTEVIDEEEFDWDSLKSNDDLELVVLRVPDGIKPKHLKHLSFSFPPSDQSRSTPLITSQKVGSLTRKNASYDIWTIPPPSSSDPSSNVDSDVFSNENEDESGSSGASGLTVGGEELLNMNVLLPRKKKGGRLFVAPKPVTHHLVLTAEPTLPTPPPTPDSNTPHPTASDPEKYKSSSRYHHPKHLLKHRFLPTGSGLRNPQSSTSIPAIESPSSPPTGIRTEDGETGKKEEIRNIQPGGSPRKKRKAEGEGKKAKKVKTSS